MTCSLTHVLTLLPVWVLGAHVLVDEADVGVVQHGVVVAHVHEQSFETPTHFIALRHCLSALRQYYGFFELQPIPTSSSLKHPQVSLLQDVCSSTILRICRTSTQVQNNPLKQPQVSLLQDIWTSTILWLLRTSTHVHGQPFETSTSFVASRHILCSLTNFMDSSNFSPSPRTTVGNIHKFHCFKTYALRPFHGFFELQPYTPSHPKRIVD